MNKTTEDPKDALARKISEKVIKEILWLILLIIGILLILYGLGVFTPTYEAEIVIKSVNFMP